MPGVFRFYARRDVIAPRHVKCFPGEEAVQFRFVSLVRIALANLEFPSSPERSVALAEEAIAQASAQRADVICFPECFVPGYRWPGKHLAAPNPAFLEAAWSAIAAAAGQADICAVVGTERLVDGRLRISALVVNRDGTIAGVQDKVQIDPS